MTEINVGAAHDKSKRNVNANIPAEKTALTLNIGDSFDATTSTTNVFVRDLAAGTPPPSESKTVQASPVATRAETKEPSYGSRAVLLLVAGVATAGTYAIIARGLPLGLVPVVLLASLGALYLFALFLVPAGNREGVRSFAQVLTELIKAALPAREAKKSKPKDME